MATKILIGLFIHLFVPILGIIFFVRLSRRMFKEKIERPPVVELFLIFATYGGFLLVVLTSLFWEWSGMASIGTAYLIIIAPFVMGVIAFRQRKLNYLSKFHHYTYISSLLYYILVPLTFGILFFFNY